MAGVPPDSSIGDDKPGLSDHATSSAPLNSSEFTDAPGVDGDYDVETVERVYRFVLLLFVSSNRLSMCVYFVES
jgi:hypothetical protein